jgi:CheY-like chemotaxis protein
MMTKQRILFVDDEPAVLQGLQNALRKDRTRWDMAFACGGPAALEELERARFDVVVSDMRMPGMDGAQLLRRVTERYPWIARVVLTGHADPHAVADALPVMNHFLAKPCDARNLRSTLERGCRLGAFLHAARGGPLPEDDARGPVAVVCPDCKRCEMREVPPPGAPGLAGSPWDAPCPGGERARCGSRRIVTLLPAAGVECDFAGLLACDMTRCPQQARSGTA